ncbi:MAG: hypothetical protein Q7S66_03375 [bacterium]|nr:hypothetical protein [bacterium]
MIAHNKKLWFLLVPIFILLTAAIINPNPFGDSPDAIGDESPFLTSALTAIKNTTLPGWEFSKTGNFYGGVQIYLDVLVLLPVIAVIRLITGNNLLTQLLVAIHTGELLHVLRLITGIAALTTIFTSVYLYCKNKWPLNFGYKLLLLLALLLGNSLFVGMIHTAKVWGLYIILEIILGIVVVAQEYSLRLQEKTFLPKDTYIAVLFWLSFFILCQNVAGVVALLWVAYAIYLGHIKLKDLFVYCRKKIFYVLALLATQLAFFYRGWLLFADHNGPFSLVNLSGQATRDSSGGIDWTIRLWRPLQIAFASQPLIIIYLLVAIITVFYLLQQKKDLTYNKLTVIAILHPILVYIIRQVILGINGPARHILPLSVAIIFSIVILLEWKTVIGKTTLILALVLCAAVAYKSIYLYWHPASEKAVNTLLARDFNSADNIFIIDGGAGRLSLPLNSHSLALLDPEQKVGGRYKFLSEHLDQIDALVKFKPTVAMAYKDHGANFYLDKFKSQNKRLFVISMDCPQQCELAETLAGTCWAVNERACLLASTLPEESTTLYDFFNSEMLGYPFFIRDKTKYEK